MSNTSQRIEHVTEGTIQRITAHPFVTELAAGTLARDAFGRYVSQNFHYLSAYARALALISGRSTDPEMVAFFARRAAYTVASEQEFAIHLMDDLAVETRSPTNVAPSPAGLGYATFIKQAAALEPIPVALAAMLPCYVVYNGVSQRLSEFGSPDPVYQRWIEMYVADDFEEGVSGVQEAVAAAARQTSDAVQERMVEHATIACRYEWLFWDSAYNDHQWPSL